MGIKLCFLLVLLHCAMTESTTIFPPCLNAPVAPNEMKCFSWSYNETSRTCHLVTGAIIRIFPGLNFIHQPGYFAGGYANNCFCKWRISPISSCHKTGFLLLDKDFCDSNPSLGTNCPVKDHIHLAHSVSQNEYYCGGNSANNCPVDNCPQGFQVSSGETYITFRSGAIGTASGFMALIKNNIELWGCNWGRSVDIMAVPKTKECTLRSLFKKSLPCECSGTCTISTQEMQSDPNLLRRAVMGIIKNPLKTLTGPSKTDILTKSYRYVNSDNRLLMEVSRRVVKNIEIFGVPVPTIAQEMEYVSTVSTVIKSSYRLKQEKHSH